MADPANSRVDPEAGAVGAARRGRAPGPRRAADRYHGGRRPERGKTPAARERERGGVHAVRVVGRSQGADRVCILRAPRVARPALNSRPRGGGGRRRPGRRRVGGFSPFQRRRGSFRADVRLRAHRRRRGVRHRVARRVPGDAPGVAREAHRARGRRVRRRLRPRLARGGAPRRRAPAAPPPRGGKKKASEEKGSNRTTALGETRGRTKRRRLGLSARATRRPTRLGRVVGLGRPDPTRIRRRAPRAAPGWRRRGLSRGSLRTRRGARGRPGTTRRASSRTSLPCLRSELGQTAAFAARAVCAARAERGRREGAAEVSPARRRSAAPRACSPSASRRRRRSAAGSNDASRAAAARERRAWAELEIDPRRAFATDSFAFAAADSGPDFGVSGVSAERALVERAPRILTRAAGKPLSAPLAAILHRKEELSPARSRRRNARRGPPDRPPRRDDRSGERKRRGPDRSEPRGRGSTRARRAREISETRRGRRSSRNARLPRVSTRETRIPLAETPGSPSRGNGSGRPPVGTETSPRRTRGGAVRSEVVIAVASLAQIKAWRWRLLDVRGAAPRAPRALTEALRGDTLRGASSPSRVASEPSDKECSPPPPRVTDPDSDSDSPAGETTTSTSSRARTRASSSSPGPGPPSPARLVGALARLLRDHHAEVVFTTRCTASTV